MEKFNQPALLSDLFWLISNHISLSRIRCLTYSLTFIVFVVPIRVFMRKTKDKQLYLYNNWKLCFDVIFLPI